jgi:hypothetical protein
MGNQAVYGRTGAAFISVEKLVEYSKLDLSSKKSGAVIPLVLFGQVDETTKQNVVKGHLRLLDVSFGTDTKQLQLLHSKNALITSTPGRFELAEQNYPLIGSLTGTAISRALYDVANDQGLAAKGTWAVNTRIRMPWFQSHQPCEELNRLPCAAYFMDLRALNPLPSDAPEDEQYLLNVFELAFKRRNMSLVTAEKVMRDQLARTDSQYDPLMTECVANIARAFTLVPTTFPYQSDIRNMATRANKFSGGISGLMAAASNAQSAVVQVESLDYAQLRGGGDCEDGTHYAYMHAKMLERGKWRSPFLQVAQKVAGFYDTVMMLGSVTSAALGNEHDVSKTAAHLRDAKYHHHQIKSQKDTHFMRSAEVQQVHKHCILNSKEDLERNVGGHSWAEMIPKHKFMEFISRLVPQTADANVSPIADRKGPTDCAWKYFLPHMVLESTGRMNPLPMPAVYYATPGDSREAIRRRSLASMASFHALIAQSPLFHSIQSEAQPTSTVNTPGQRLTDFYIQSTQAFTDAYLDKTGAAAFNWVQLQPIDEALPAESPFFARLSSNEQVKPDPLFEKGDALSRENIENITTRFVHSAGLASAAPKSPAEALSTLDHTKVLHAMAIGAVVGESSVKHVDPAKLTLGVDLELRIADRPFAPNVGLVPIGALTPLEARALASQMRHLPPDEAPSRKLSMFATGENVEFVRQSMDNLDETSPTAMARLCDHPKLVEDQRRRVAAITDATNDLFIDRPWLTDAKEIAKDNLHLHSFFFKPHDLVNDNAVTGVANELKRFKESGLVHTARFYVEHPTQNHKTCVLQVLCTEPADSKDL